MKEKKYVPARKNHGISFPGKTLRYRAVKLDPQNDLVRATNNTNRARFALIFRITTGKLAPYHKDPFDRFLIWEAIRNNFILMSADKNMELKRRIKSRILRPKCMKNHTKNTPKLHITGLLEKEDRFLCLQGNVNSTAEEKFSKY
jgi:hypothetical protein